MGIKVIGIDIAKSVFQLHGRDEVGRVVLEKRLSRGQFLTFVGKLPRCLIGIEAGGGAHYWGSELGKLGHEVRLIAPQFVKPFVKSNKNDARDAEAICETLTRPGMRFVPVKTPRQLEQQAVHRVRTRLISARTALVNEIRGLMAEHGIVFARSPRVIRREMSATVEKMDRLSELGKGVFSQLRGELGHLDEQIEHYDGLLDGIEKAQPVCQRLRQVPGIGPITATAIVSMTDPTQFESGRQFAAWVGLVPRQHSSGGKERLLGMSKRGNPYLRTLLVHGARSVIRHASGKEDRTSQWLGQLVERRGKNRAAVALANKNARIIWAMLTRDEDYRAA